MDAKLIDRIFGEIDKNCTKIEALSRLVYENATTLTHTARLVMIIITFLIISSLGVLYQAIKPPPINSALSISDELRQDIKELKVILEERRNE